MVAEPAAAAVAGLVPGGSTGLLATGDRIDRDYVRAGVPRVDPLHDDRAEHGIAWWCACGVEYRTQLQPPT